MNLKRRILSCIILMIFLAIMCLVGYFQQSFMPTIGRAFKDEDSKKIALTFDDGPHPYYTEQLLKGLKERDAKATFFITGQNVEAYPEIVREIYEDDHLIGNHTYSHIQLTSSNAENFKKEIIKTNEVIKEVTGEDTIYVRPPYGSWNKEFEKELLSRKAPLEFFVKYYWFNIKKTVTSHLKNKIACVQPFQLAA